MLFIPQQNLCLCPHHCSGPFPKLAGSVRERERACEMAVMRAVKSLPFSSDEPQRTRLTACAFLWPATMPTTPARLMPACCTHTYHAKRAALDSMHQVSPPPASGLTPAGRDRGCSRAQGLWCRQHFIETGVRFFLKRAVSMCNTHTNIPVEQRVRVAALPAGMTRVRRRSRLLLTRHAKSRQVHATLASSLLVRWDRMASCREHACAFASVCVRVHVTAEVHSFAWSIAWSTST